MVAEMMGWERDDGPREYWRHPDSPAWPCHTDHLPKWSTDIAASLDGVIGFMAEQGYWCIMKTPFQPGGAFHAGFTPHNTTGWNGRADHRGSGRALPLAICRAALLWWIEQEEEL